VYRTTAAGPLGPLEEALLNLVPLYNKLEAWQYRYSCDLLEALKSKIMISNKPEIACAIGVSLDPNFAEKVEGEAKKHPFEERDDKYN
jgi:hypothetical protein